MEYWWIFKYMGSNELSTDKRNCEINLEYYFNVTLIFFIIHQILDASFDHLLPLALNHMPSLWKSIVTLAISEYVNLNNLEQLLKYQGPVLLIRRTQDEVICTRWVWYELIQDF